MTVNKKFKAYFYNGFAEPKLIATSIKELEAISISDTYTGFITEDLLETTEDCKNLSDLAEELPYFDIYINPTKEDFIEANKAWFDKNSLETHLEKW
jgi:hypothetical protein